MFDDLDSAFFRIFSTIKILLELKHKAIQKALLLNWMHNITMLTIVILGWLSQFFFLCFTLFSKYPMKNYIACVKQKEKYILWQKHKQSLLVGDSISHHGYLHPGLMSGELNAWGQPCWKVNRKWWGGKNKQTEKPLVNWRLCSPSINGSGCGSEGHSFKVLKICQTFIYLKHNNF